MKKILILCLCLCFGFIANAKPSIEKTLQDLQNNYTKLDSFKAEIDQELFHRESNTTEKRKGSILFAQSDNIVLETKSPNPELIVVNAKEIWNYLPDEEVAYRYHPTALENSQIALSILTGQNKISDNFEVEELNEEGSLIGLLLYPNEPTSHLVEAQIWVNPKTNLIEKLTILDFFGNTNSISFKKFTPNFKTKKSDFEFKPPMGIDVEDRFDQ